MQIYTEIVIPGKILSFRLLSDLEYKEFLGLSFLEVCHLPMFLNYEL